MKENKNRNRDHDRRHDEDDDQLRDNTMNETIREVRGDRDLNEIKNNRRDIDTDQTRSIDVGDTDLTQGVNYTPNDSSGVRSGGLTDMDDQTAGGAGLNTGARKGSGSHLRTKDGISGSDFDGQNATS
jgi:hypothetical protein